ncbi:phage major capsid protein [Cerasicoccus frondis]|uniref:phage major capsid protein n=1 Tax=Cerasicoccus frondis TaxID=490090 RepID=UPI002852B130|nr:phage major capsid protein [Cerasicoccus frondis]
MTISELKQKRAALVKDMRALLDKASKEGRDLNADETTNYEAMEADVEKHGKQIQRAENLAALENNLQGGGQSPYQPEIEGEADEQEGPRASKGYNLAFFNGYGRVGKNGMNPQHFAALQVGTDSEGGYLVPTSWELDLIKALPEMNVVRRYARVMATASDRNIPVRGSRAGFTWIDEEGAYGKDDPAYGNLVLGAHKTGGIIQVSEELLQDNSYNLAGELQIDASEEYGYIEESGFCTGNGVGKPVGLFATTAVAGANVTGYQGAINATPVVTADDLIETFHALAKRYRARAVWLTSDAIAKQIRKLKDGNGQYLWAPSLREGEPDRLHGRPFEVSDSAPVPAAEGKSIIFGDLKYYRIVDRLGMTMQRLNELYAENGQVGFKFTKRLDAKLTLADAITFFQHGAAA